MVYINLLGLTRKAVWKLLLSQDSLNPYYNNNKHSCYGSNCNLSCMVFGHIIIYYITYVFIPVLGIRVGAMNPLNFNLSYLIYWKTFIRISASPRTNQMGFFNFLISTRKLCFECVLRKLILGHELAYQLSILLTIFFVEWKSSLDVKK